MLLVAPATLIKYSQFLDPFAGSGSTLVAARDNGFQYIGIELTEEYLPIIQARTGCEIIKPITNTIVEKVEK